MFHLGTLCPKEGWGTCTDLFGFTTRPPWRPRKSPKAKATASPQGACCLVDFFLNIFTVDDLEEPQDPKMKNLDEIGACLDHHSRANPEMRGRGGGRTKGRSAAAPCVLPGNMSPLRKSLKVVNSQVENDQCKMMMRMMMDSNCLIGDSLEGTENVDRI